MCVQSVFSTFLYTSFFFAFSFLFWRYSTSRKYKSEISELNSRIKKLEEQNQELASEERKQRIVGDFLFNKVNSLGTGGIVVQKILQGDDPAPAGEEEAATQ